MSSYDSRPVTLDPGLTALALRGLREPSGQYPFLDPYRRRRQACRTAITRGPFWARALSWLIPGRRMPVAPTRSV